MDLTFNPVEESGTVHTLVPIRGRNAGVAQGEDGVPSLGLGEKSASMGR